MTPKEKAKEFVDKYYYDSPNNGYLKEGTSSCENNWNESKQKAITNIDNKLKRASILYKSELDYWTEVKQEIEKL
jgi:hypothetical protein